jgi:isopentenyl diphosphate isomerase/L-lactate dehydrogenase-like FMN-dependent dehydrogenase
MIASSVSTLSVEEIAAAGGVPPWFQLYPTPVRRVTELLLRRAVRAGCRAVFLTVDTPAIGNRERHRALLERLLAGARKGNFDDLPELPSGTPIIDPSLTWDIVGWLRSKTRMRIGLKGIVTAEDAELAARHGVDAVIVSNHGARQLESDRATFDCLPEVVGAIDGRLPVLVDGGFRRGTDVFKALALGASAVSTSAAR